VSEYLRDVAIVARLKRSFWYSDRKFYELEPIQETGPLKICDKHPQPVWFEGEQCPCCQIIAEFGRSVEAG
jgi:hypothetical protein